MINDIDQYYAERAGDTRLDGRYAPTSAAHTYLLRQRDAAIVKVLEQWGMFPLRERTILDVGCGAAWQLRRFVDLGADPRNCVGVEVNQHRLSVARYHNAHMTFLETSAEAIPQPDRSFDVVTQFTAFSSMPSHEMREASAREMRRLVKDGGIILWYDFRVRRPGNRYVTPMGARTIRALFPSCTVHLSSQTLAPPLARAIAPRSVIACLLLEKLPWLRTHYLATIHPGNG